MKKKLYQIILLVVLFFTIHFVNAQEDLVFSSLNTYNIKNISNIISFEEGYIFTSYDNNNTTIYKYNQNDTLKSSKQIENLKNSKIIKYNNNIMVIGITENTLKIYLLDYNLQIKKQLKTSYIVNYKTNLQLYNYNNKIYIMLIEDGILSDNNLYEIDENFTISIKNLSSIDSNNVKEILKGDYYLLHFNSNIESSMETSNYLSTTYLEEKYILVGNRTYENDLKEKGLITIVDKNGNKLVDEINDKYISYQAVEIVKNRIIILANNEEKKSFILTYNFDGTLLSEVEIKNDLNNQYITDMYKLANKLVFTIPYQEGDIKEESYLILYNYNLSINKENSAYGTINIDENALPYTKVFFDILPNSGYEIDNISIKDYQGKIIETSENSFIMPENDIILSVTYKESIVNPETIDLITLIFISVFIIATITIKLYKKMSWLK